MKKHKRKDFLKVVRFNLEVGLRVGADWANFWSVFADDDVATAAADPNSIAVFREDFFVVDILE